MCIKRFAALLTFFGLLGHAVVLEAGAHIEFIVPADTQVMGGDANDIAIFTGRPLGTMDAGLCSTLDDHPVQNVIFVHPGSGRSTFASVILTNRSDALPAGTQLAQIEAHGECEGPGGSVYHKYVGYVQ